MDNKTKPPGSLGSLETLAVQIGLLKQSKTPTLANCTLILFIADHGIAEDGVSAYPQVVTQQMARNFLNGGAAANVLARTHNVKIRLVNAGMIQPIDHPSLIDESIGQGTNNFRLTQAMDEVQRDKALETGRRIVKSMDDDALCFGEMGIGNTSAASLLLHKILELPLNEIVGRGTGLDDKALQRKKDILKDAAARTPTPLPPITGLLEYGGFEIAMMVGAMLAAAVDRKVVVVDGFIATAAAAIALKIEPSIHPAFVFSHRSAEWGHRAVLDYLNAQPLLDLQLRLGEGTGALLAWPLIRSAAAILSDMASFDSAQVSGPSETQQEQDGGA